MIIRSNNLKEMEPSTLNFIYFLAVIGGLVFIILISKLFWSFIKAILPSKNFKARYGEKNWVVVTGGSDGIGLGFCQEFAALGFNICMIARNKTKMQQAMTKIKDVNERSAIEGLCIVADFSQCTKQGFFPNIMKQLEGIDVSILVNNVGIANIGYLHEIPEQRLVNEVNINVMGMTLMTYHMLPRLLKRQPRGAIINVSSVSAEYPIPYIAAYGATKAYNNFFSQSIQMEYSHKLDVLSLRPMLVQSNLSRKKKSLMVASRNQCAKSTIKYLGIDYETNGYFMHRLVSYIMSFLPKPVIRCLAQSESRKIMEETKVQL